MKQSKYRSKNNTEMKFYGFLLTARVLLKINSFLFFYNIYLTNYIKYKYH